MPKWCQPFLNKSASENNPTRIGYFVRTKRRTGKLNPGLCYELTDKKGKFWEIEPEYLTIIEDMS